MAFCTSCGAQLPDNARFCIHCGVAVEAGGGPGGPQPPAAPGPTGMPPGAPVGTHDEPMTAVRPAPGASAAAQPPAAEGGWVRPRSGPAAQSPPPPAVPPGPPAYAPPGYPPAGQGHAPPAPPAYAPPGYAPGQAPPIPPAYAPPGHTPAGQPPPGRPTGAGQPTQGAIASPGELWGRYGNDVIRIALGIVVMLVGLSLPWNQGDGVDHLPALLAALVAMLAFVIDPVLQPGVTGRYYAPRQLLLIRLALVLPLVGVGIWAIVAHFVDDTPVGPGVVFLLGGAALAATGTRRTGDPALSGLWRAVVLVSLVVSIVWAVVALVRTFVDLSDRGFDTMPKTFLVMMTVIIVGPAVVGGWLLRRVLRGLPAAWPAALAFLATLLAWELLGRMFTDTAAGSMGEGLNSSAGTYITLSVAFLVVGAVALVAPSVLHAAEPGPEPAGYRVAVAASSWLVLALVLWGVMTVTGLVATLSNEYGQSGSTAQTVWLLVLTAVSLAGAFVVRSMVRREPAKARIVVIGYAVLVALAFWLTVAISDGLAFVPLYLPLAGFAWAAPTMAVALLAPRHMRLALGPMQVPGFLAGAPGSAAPPQQQWGQPPSSR